ncbi:MAG: trypsin-like peptidase domain-containing protein [Gammaproteobacteria bacterium]|nr:trypsin-like peptidase domain-containing protein [Gammaproteobacteria bacterium]
MLNEEDASKFRINVLDYKKSGQSAWDLPTWSYPLAQGVMPLCAIVNEHLIPVGTAFLISKHGIVATAAHVIQEALRENPTVHQAIIKGSSRKEHSVKHVQLAVLHHRKIDKEITQVSAWPLENVQIAHPTDVAFGFLKFQQSFPYMSFLLSPATPRIGETVFSIGYCDSKFPDGGIPLREIKDGTFDWHQAFSHRFHVAEGKVEAIFVKRFSRGYAEGPCFLTDSYVEYGQSGGPVFNSAGNICGINLGGASMFTNNQNSLASLIYPALAIELKLTVKLGGALTFNAYQPLINFISNGGITTDGSEELSRISVEGDEFLVCPLIHKDDAKYTFNDLHGYLNTQPADPLKESDEKAY